MEKLLISDTKNPKNLLSKLLVFILFFTELEGPILLPHAIEKSTTKCPYEKIFRSEQYALLENACREYVFLSEFFMVQGTQADDLFFLVFGKTLGLLQKSVEDYVIGSYDCIALFLCAHLIVKFREMSREKGVTAMERYWSTSTKLFLRKETLGLRRSYLNMLAARASGTESSPCLRVTKANLSRSTTTSS